jgi:hypothetical protein
LTDPKRATHGPPQIVLRIKRGVKIWSIGALTGSGTSLSFVLMHNALTVDLMFDIWEFGVAAITPILVVVAVTLITRSKIYVVFPVAYLTLIMPVVGAFFGSSGSEPIWQFALLGMVGGLIWSTPLALWSCVKSRS